ncbi:ribulose-phosphate 3-epimerase [Olsenella sp. An270]|uniref:ribulose-phosphate 3-epimerase n=1 Tax=Olsenella sp. An270 TaxID=1965615 RepID=UPI000B560F9E|nr:ribulose-phosphate 3-epimerase [Olsenella sp. An270]OUO61025.1 ribulose-phosphate 3-epimerase [Olsenella sp. An270]
MNAPILIAPSVLAADYGHIADEVAEAKTADLIHVDVMDGHFVPNISFGVDFLRTVKESTELPVDVHLMISNPDQKVESYLDAGADILTFHYEAATHAHRIVSVIHDRGAKASIALNPATPVSVLEPIIEDLDMVLIMTVDPGYGGQRFIESSLKKLRRLRRLCAEHGVNPRVEVDGGIVMGNVAQAVASGANVIVAGSSVFRAADRAVAIRELRRHAERGVSKMA